MSRAARAQIQQRRFLDDLKRFQGAPPANIATAVNERDWRGGREVRASLARSLETSPAALVAEA